MTKHAKQLLEEVKKNIESMDKYHTMTWDIEDIHLLGRLLLSYEKPTTLNNPFGESLSDRINNYITK